MYHVNNDEHCCCTNSAKPIVTTMLIITTSLAVIVTMFGRPSGCQQMDKNQNEGLHYTCKMHRFAFPAQCDATVLVDLGNA